MSGLSLLDPLAWDPAALKLHPAYLAGNTAGWLTKAGALGTNHYLSGRLYISKSGWLLLSVPNALVRGVFDAMTATGAELPTMSAFKGESADKELLNAHISVMTADEVRQIGADKINERGHHFHYALGAVREFSPEKAETLSRVWAIQVASPELAALRKSYGLSALPNGDHQFHITVAVRRKNVLGPNEVAKIDGTRGELKAAEVKDVLHGGAADHMPDTKFKPKALAQGKEHEHEHTTNDEVAKEIAKDHLLEDPQYYKKVEEIEKDANSIYLNQLGQTLNPMTRTGPIPYDPNKAVFANIADQLLEAKRRGDFIQQTQRNQHIYRATMDPRYRHTLALEAFHGRMPQPGVLDQVIERYGDGVLASLPGR